jgi:hypothetical protein
LTAGKSLSCLFVFFSPCSPPYTIPPFSPLLQNSVYLLYFLSWSFRMQPSSPPCRRFFFPYPIFGAPCIIDSHGYIFFYYYCRICLYSFT